LKEKSGYGVQINHDGSKCFGFWQAGTLFNGICLSKDGEYLSKSVMGASFPNERNKKDVK